MVKSLLYQENNLDSSAFSGVILFFTGLDKKLINAVSLEEFDIKYKVADVSMNINKLKSTGITPLSVEKSIEKIRQEVEKKVADKIQNGFQVKISWG